MLQLDDTALQLYKDGDYGAYLDLEASISEQQEEFEGFQTKYVSYQNVTFLITIYFRKQYIFEISQLVLTHLLQLQSEYYEN